MLYSNYKYSFQPSVLDPTSFLDSLRGMDDISQFYLQTGCNGSLTIGLCPSMCIGLACGKQQDAHEFLLEFQEGILKKTASKVLLFIKPSNDK